MEDTGHGGGGGGGGSHLFHLLNAGHGQIRVDLSNVDLQVIRLCVRSLAVRTVEGSFPGVHNHVTLQLPTGRESLSAVSAFKVKRTGPAAPCTTLRVS